MSGAVIVVHQNRLIRQFREAQATTPKSASTLAELGCRDSWIFRRMEARGVFIETSDGRYYMDEESARAFVKRRWQRMLIYLATVILLFVVWLMFRW
jgi:uncharacterized membrane-anchored protein